MNEQAIKDAYDLFVQNGYTKTIDDFKVLIASNEQALNDAYDLFVENGYGKKPEDFKMLMGLGGPVSKKKVDTTALPSGDASLASSTKPTEPVEEQGWLLNVVSAIDRGALKTAIGDPIKGLGTFTQQIASKLRGGDGRSELYKNVPGTPENIGRALLWFGESFNKAIDELTPQDEKFKNSLSDQFSQAFGQLGGQLLTGGLSGAASRGAAALAAQATPRAAAVTAAKKLGGELADPMAISSGLAMGQAEFERAKQAGATDDQAFEAFYKNAAVGSVLEKVPVMQFFKRFNNATQGGVANYIKTKGVAGITGGLEEMTTEVLQQLYANATAKDIYNINQDLFEGLTESGGIGFGVGFVINAMGARAKVLREQGRNQEADAIEAQIDELTSQAEKGGKPSYKAFGITVEQAAIDNLIEIGSAEDLVKANIQIENDPERAAKLQQRIVTTSMKEQVRAANPNLNEESLDQITALELELQKLSGNTTQVGKDRAAAIRQQIRDVQEGKQVKETLESELSKWPRYKFAQENQESERSKEFLDDPRAYMERMIQLANDQLKDNPNDERAKAILENNTKDLETYNQITAKYKQDAVQEQAAGQVPVQSEAGVGEEVAQGVAQPEPQGVAEEGAKEEVVSLRTPEVVEVSMAPITIEPAPAEPAPQSIDALIEDLQSEEVTTILNKETEMLIAGEAVKRRQEGRFTKDGVEYVRNAPIQEAPTGSIGDVRFTSTTDAGGGVSVPFKYRLIEAEQLQPSHQDGRRNPMHFIPEAQPKNRNDVGTINAEESFANRPRFAEMGENTNAYSGAPVVNARGEVVQGNNRSAGIRKGYQRGNMAYRDALAANAEKFGFTAEQVQGMKNPVLVREIDVNDDAAIELGNYDVKDLETGSRARIDPVTVVRRMPMATKGRLAEIMFRTDKTVNAAVRENERAVIEILSPFLNQAQRNTIAPSGRLTDVGISNIEEMARQLLFDNGDPNLPEIFDQLPATQRAILQKSLPALLSTPYDKSIVPDVQVAMIALAEFFDSKSSWRSWLAQTDVFSGGLTARDKYTPFELELARILANPSSQRQVVGMFNEYASLVNDKKADMFEPAREGISREEGVRQTFNVEYEQRKPTEAGSPEVSGETQVTPPAEPTQAAEPVATAEPTQAAEPATESVADLLTADTNDATTLQKIDDFLGKIEDSLDKFGRETAGVNLALPVIKAIIKTVRALVKTGITLQEAIERAAAENNVSQADVVDAIKQYATMQEEAGKGQGTTEMELPGYNKLMQDIDRLVEVSKQPGRDAKKILEKAIEFARASDVFKNASDVQKEQIFRDVRSKFGKSQRSAPSVKRILGKPDDTIEVSEMAALADQIRLEARAARDAKNDLNAKRKMLGDVIRKMQDGGKISAKKASALINKISKVNLYSDVAINKLVDYAKKIFADAEYAEKLSSGNKLRKALKKLSKNKDKFANLREVASGFLDIDPSMVEDINRYNQIAGLLVESLRGSSTRGGKLKLADMVNVNDITPYIKEETERQQKQRQEDKLAELTELLGMEGSGLSYEELLEIADGTKEAKDVDEKQLRSSINKAFDILSGIAKEMMSTGKDPFTDEDVEITDRQRELIGKFIRMNLDVVSSKRAVESIDALMNFIQNGSLAKMQTMYDEYLGNYNARELESKGVRSFPISKYFSKSLGRLLISEFANLNIMFERLFRGFERGGNVEEKMGVTRLKNEKARAQTQANKIVTEYIDKFFKSKPNGKAFNSSFNNIERGMLGFMSRSIIGTEAEMKAEFKRRKDLILESIDQLMKGNDREVEKGQVYKEVYDKIMEGSETVSDIEGKVDKINKDAVDFWRTKWDEIYDELSDVALSVYNKILGKDINYIPDRFTKLSNDTTTDGLVDDEMAFIAKAGGNDLYKKETGVLMKATYPDKLPRSKENKDIPTRYIDLSFDANNANSMYDALVDIRTAGAIRQINAFLNSSAWLKIVPSQKDRVLVKNRIKLFVNNVRNKNAYSTGELSDAVRKMNRIATIGVGQALGGVTQPLKQVVPVAMNTLINGGGLDIAAVFNKAKNDFINRSGYSIANRGIESQAQIESINRLLDEEAKGAAGKLFNAIEKANQMWLKVFLAKPDVFIARASWMTYYEQSLKKQGIDPATIDYDTVEVNETAANYAQRMVDRQQNVSDTDLAGEMFSNSESARQVLVKTLMPFASFRMNQSARLGADLEVIFSRSATKEDKAIAARSLSGFAVEQATFRAISAGVTVVIGALASSIMGDDDEDKEKEEKKMDAIIKGQATGIVADVFSPIPAIDKLVQGVVNIGLQLAQDAIDVEDEDRLSIYTDAGSSFIKSLGLFGISAERATALFDMVKLGAGGSFTDAYGRKKYLSKPDQETVVDMIGPAILSSIGLAPSEVNSVVRSVVSEAKRNASTKEGGKSESDIEIERMEKQLQEEAKYERMDKNDEKVRMLESMLRGKRGKKAEVIERLIMEYSMTDEEKKEIRESSRGERLQEQLEMDELLQGYDNKSDMNRYDPDLYERTFGENSKYYRENKDEMEIEKELRDKLQKKEDVESIRERRNRRRSR